MNIRGERGFTLTELSVAMSVFLIFMALATPLMFSQLRTAIQTEEDVDLQQAARSATRTMLRELRQASELYSTVEKPTRKDAISFGVDLDGDGMVNASTDSTKPLEQITYYLEGDVLYRGSDVGSGDPLADDVTGLVFSIYGSNLAFDANADATVTETELDRNGNGVWEASELANVTRVDVGLTVGRNDDAQTYEASAWLRNREAG